MSRKRLFNDKEKWCNKCSKWLVLDAFGLNKRTASGRQDYCKTCHGTYFGTWWDKVAAFDKVLLEKFQMQPGEYLEQWKRQDKLCMVCDAALILYQRDTRVRVIGTSKVLVCADCDRGLTAFKENGPILHRAAALLAKFSS